MASCLQRSEPDDSRHHPHHHRAQPPARGSHSHPSATRVLPPLLRRQHPLGPYGMVGISLYILERIPDRAVLSFRQFGHRHRYVSQPHDHQPGRGWRAAGQHLPLGHCRLRNISPAVVVRHRTPAPPDHHSHPSAPTLCKGGLRFTRSGNTHIPVYPHRRETSHAA